MSHKVDVACNFCKWVQPISQNIWPNSKQTENDIFPEFPGSWFMDWLTTNIRLGLKKNIVPLLSQPLRVMFKGNRKMQTKINIAFCCLSNFSENFFVNIYIGQLLRQKTYHNVCLCVHYGWFLFNHTKHNNEKVPWHMMPSWFYAKNKNQKQ